jgi:prepilin-type N-terminal cleavage/methylation domain-containing protein
VMLFTPRIPYRRGYTLLEMIVVLAVVASLSAVILPALLRPAGKAELRQLAKQVQAALLDARTRAVESGVVQEFRYEPGGRRYEIVSRDEEDGVRPPGAPGPGAAKTPSRPADSAAPEPWHAVLPDGVVFADPREEMRGEPASPPATAEIVAIEDAATGEKWSALLRFYPNGRGPNARLKLRGSASWSIDILLRGLTGTALVGQPRREQKTPETSSHASWSPGRVSDSR